LSSHGQKSPDWQAGSCENPQIADNYAAPADDTAQSVTIVQSIPVQSCPFLSIPVHQAAPLSPGGSPRKAEWACIAGRRAQDTNQIKSRQTGPARKNSTYWENISQYSKFYKIYYRFTGHL